MKDLDHLDDETLKAISKHGTHKHKILLTKSKSGLPHQAQVNIIDHSNTEIIDSLIKHHPGVMNSVYTHYSLSINGGNYTRSKLLKHPRLDPLAKENIGMRGTDEHREKLLADPETHKDPSMMRCIIKGASPKQLDRIEKMPNQHPNTPLYIQMKRQGKI